MDQPEFTQRLRSNCILSQYGLGFKQLGSESCACSTHHIRRQGCREHCPLPILGTLPPTRPHSGTSELPALPQTSTKRPQLLSVHGWRRGRGRGGRMRAQPTQPLSSRVSASLGQGGSGQWQGQGEIVQCPQSPEIRFQRPLQGLGSGTLSQGCEDRPLRCAALEWRLGGSPGGRRPPSTVGTANCRAAGLGRGCSPVSGLLSSEGPQLVTEEPSLTDSIPQGGLNGEGREFGPGAGDGGLPPPDPLSLYPSVRSAPLSLPCRTLGAQETEQMPSGGGVP